MTLLAVAALLGTQVWRKGVHTLVHLIKIYHHTHYNNNNVTSIGHCTDINLISSQARLHSISCSEGCATLLYVMNGRLRVATVR